MPGDNPTMVSHAMSEVPAWLTFAAALISPVVAVLAFQRGGRQQTEARFDSVTVAMRAEIDKISAVEGKARHELANNTQRVTDELRRDLKEIERHAVRREDMDGLEVRVRTEMTAMEGRMTKRLDGIDAKLDRALERGAGGD